MLLNVEILLDKNSCPQCNLSGAELNRFDLSGANLEGADLTRAKMYLANLSGANLRRANLQEAQFGGADLGGADLRGANLTGTSFAGAYMSGTLLEGKMVETTPYAADDISDVEQKVYVDDTEKPKRNPQTEDLTILDEEKKEIAPVPELVAVEGNDPEPMVQDGGYGEVEQNQDTVSDTGEVEQEFTVADKTEPKSNPQTDKVTILDDEKKQKTDAATLVTEENNEVTALASEAENLPPVLQDETYKEVVQNKSVAPDSKMLPAINTVRIMNESVTATEPTRIMIGDVKEQDVESELESVQEENMVVEDNSEQLEVEKGTTETVAEEIVAEETVVENVEIVNEVIAALEAPVLSEEILRNLERLLDDNKCYGCNLVGVNLTGENLDSADLEGANLTDAVLVDADLEDANLKQANLTNVDLTGAELTGADLYKANLTKANLSGATFEGTMVDDAIMTDVKGYQQNMLMMAPE